MSGLDSANDEVYNLYVPDDLIDPYNITTWGGAGVPEAAIEVGYELIDKCWSDEMILAELLTEDEVSEMKPETGAERLLDDVVGNIPSVTNLLMQVESDRDALQSAQICRFITDSYLCSTGHGCSSNVHWRNTCAVMLNAGIFPLLATLFEIVAALTTTEHDDDSATTLDNLVSHTIKLLVTSVTSLLIGSGIGLPHPSVSKREQSEVVSEETLAVVKESLSSNGYQIISNVYQLIRGYTGQIPGQKLIIMLHCVLATVCGPVDIKPAVWKAPENRSERWVGDGVVDCYIDSILQSGETCSRLAFLSKGLLMAYYYHILDEVLRCSMEKVEIDEESLPEHPPKKFSGIPLPIREALVIFAISIGKNLEKRRDGTLQEKELPGDTAEPDVQIPAERPEISLLPEYPPPEDCFLQPSKRYRKIGSPPPGVWHAFQHPDYVRAETIPSTCPKETIYRKLVPILPGLVVRLFRMFLSSLPAEGEQKKPPDNVDLPSNKHRSGDVLVKCVSGFLVYLLKLFSTCSPVQSEVVLQHMGDSNGLLLLLKFLHQERIIPVPDRSSDPDNIDSPRLYPPLPEEVLPFPTKLSLSCKCATAEGPATCNARNLLTCSSVFHLIRKLIRKHPSRLTLTLFYKMHILVRRKVRVQHPLLTLYGVKLFNDLNPFMGRRWRTMNSSILSQLYHYRPPTMVDTMAALMASSEPHDPNGDLQLPVPESQREVEAFHLQVVQCYNSIEYPSLKAAPC
eukprot:TRINITY_DN13541_c0_g1_i1.p1 TRINITY_DN13541_c0_g1~~TRINITY_DN13541_c0_g1_i1.p1  ORF type:complete len:739 (+),score=79.92 TRINITY_DN13541_c0_g1_i1:45-2261(+)